MYQIHLNMHIFIDEANQILEYNYTTRFQVTTFERTDYVEKTDVPMTYLPQINQIIIKSLVCLFFIGYVFYGDFRDVYLSCSVWEMVRKYSVDWIIWCSV